MKKVIISSAAMALLIFSGCADKEPAVDERVQEEVVVAKEVEPLKSEVVSGEDSYIDENAISSSDSNEMRMANLEDELQTIYFDFDKFNIRNDMQDNVSNSATVAKGDAKDFTIKLEGNCDEWGSDEYNFALGLKRASSVKKALMSEGVDDSRITMVSYGESNPVCTEKTRECWAKNRRVDFKLLP